MQKHNITFGAHTVTHPNLPGINRKEAEREIEQSKVELEQILKSEVTTFSFPNSGGLYPHFDEFTVRAVRKAGFVSAVTSVRGCADEHADPFRLSRIGINRSASTLPDFLWRLEKERLAS